MCHDKARPPTGFGFVRKCWCCCDSCQVPPDGAHLNVPRRCRLGQRERHGGMRVDADEDVIELDVAVHDETRVKVGEAERRFEDHEPRRLLAEAVALAERPGCKNEEFD
jgi:hypothetical protein